MDTTILITFWITGVVFVAVILFMAYCVLRFRYQEGRRAEYKPEDKKLEWWLTGLTAVGVAGMLIPGLFVWNQFVNVPPEATEIEVLGQQWQWSFRYPGKDGVLGTTNIRLISDDNPFGLDPKDANGQDDVLVEGDDLHMPIGAPIKVLLRSLDVLHDFYVPQFRAKMDMVPGMVTFFWLTPTRSGTFDILCFELCGVGHHAMRGNVVVEAKDAFEAWMGEQETFAQTMARAGSGAKNPTNLALNTARSVAAEKQPAK
jgi:cytochrome c oxidase subunit 2|tara:strand:- start:677 stop:1450 length:774 start_codon:yes stop_codon:yes gene_type:complete